MRAPLAVVVAVTMAVPVSAVARVAPGLLARVVVAHDVRRAARPAPGPAARDTAPETPPRLPIPSAWFTEAAW